MSQIASFYLLKDGQRQELSNGDCSGAVYMAIWDWCESELDLDVRFPAPQTENTLDLSLIHIWCGSSASPPGWHSMPEYSGCTRPRRSTAGAVRRMPLHSAGYKGYSPCPSASRPTRRPAPHLSLIHIYPDSDRQILSASGSSWRWPPCS